MTHIEHLLKQGIDVRPKLAEAVRIFQASAHEKRLRILNLLFWGHQAFGPGSRATIGDPLGGGEVSVIKDCLGLDQAEFSLHAEMLEKTGLIVWNKPEELILRNSPGYGLEFIIQLHKYLFCLDTKENLFAKDFVNFIKAKRKRDWEKAIEAYEKRAEMEGKKLGQRKKIPPE